MKIKLSNKDLEKLFKEAKKVKPRYILSAEDIDKMIENEVQRLGPTK